ncbi:MAG: exodeoxyribonuclease VII small subunit [Propionibacteriaceae bacterium]|jgi:exodeoxyribonuclease VII small subunit|nr:exodeoxyribonuclease VII small subunit [Propionibacteriaceae bacterium]
MAKAKDEAQLPDSYEEARAQLAQIVEQLEAGDVPLTEAMQLWERGEKLADVCDKWLQGALAKVQQAVEPDPEPEPQSAEG